MSAYILRVLFFISIALIIIQANPLSPIQKVKWIPARVARPFVIQNGPTSGQYRSSSEGDQDSNDNHGFATWLFRSRKFCCAPPL